MTILIFLELILWKIKNLEIYGKKIIWEKSFFIAEKILLYSKQLNFSSFSKKKHFIGHNNISEFALRE